MPVSSPLAPKSVLRHRPLDSGKTTKPIPTVTRASRPPHPRKEIVPPFVYSTPRTTRTKVRSQSHLVSIGIGMVVALLAVLLGQLLLGWCSTTWDDLHYGRPRTYQTDAMTGDEPGATPSHFIVHI